MISEENRFVIAVYRAKPLKWLELKEIVQTHVLTLQSLDLATSQPPVLMEASNETIVEIFVWKDKNSSQNAHRNPQVQEIWQKLSSVAEILKINDLTEANAMFPLFKPLFSEATFPALTCFTDTMLGANDFQKLVGFYKQVFNFQVPQDDGKGFLILRDGWSGQSLCITDGASVSRAAPSFRVVDLEDSIAILEKAGGKTLKRWEYAKMQGANCQDLEGNEILLYTIIP